MNICMCLRVRACTQAIYTCKVCAYRHILYIHARMHADFQLIYCAYILYIYIHGFDGNKGGKRVYIYIYN